jgi:hypothetical protein
MVKTTVAVLRGAYAEPAIRQVAAPKRRLRLAMVLKSIVFGFTNLAILCIWGICLYFTVYVIEHDMMCSIMGTSPPPTRNTFLAWLLVDSSQLALVYL